MISVVEKWRLSAREPHIRPLEIRPFEFSNELYKKGRNSDEKGKNIGKPSGSHIRACAGPERMRWGNGYVEHARPNDVRLIYGGDVHHRSWGVKASLFVDAVI